jgi:hypothetical protein
MHFTIRAREETSSVSEIICKKNIAYMVLEDKLHRVEQILRKNPILIYVRNRSQCIEISSQHKILALKQPYHMAD